MAYTAQDPTIVPVLINLDVCHAVVPFGRNHSHLMALAELVDVSLLVLSPSQGVHWQQSVFISGARRHCDVFVGLWEKHNTIEVDDQR